MSSTGRMWNVAGVLLVGVLVSLSICINACVDVTPVATSCPHHQESSDCCKHPSGNVAALSWNTQKQHSHIVSAASVHSMEIPIAVSFVQECDHLVLSSLAKFHDSSGPPFPRILSLRI